MKRIHTKLLSGLLAILMFTFSNSTAWSAVSNLKINIQGQSRPIPVSTYIYNGHVMVSLEFLEQNLPLEVTKDETDASLHLTACDQSITLPSGTNIVNKGTQSQTLDPAPVWSGNSVMVPLRPVCELLGQEVGWDNATHTVTIQSNQSDIDLNLTSLKVQRPTGEDKDSIDLLITIDLTKDLTQQYTELNAVLEQILSGDSTIPNILEYIKAKRQADNDLPLQRWRINKRIISVESTPQQNTIQIIISQPST